MKNKEYEIKEEELDRHILSNPETATRYLKQYGIRDIILAEVINRYVPDVLNPFGKKMATRYNFAKKTVSGQMEQKRREISDKFSATF